MTKEEYFRDWIKVIDQKELSKILSTINILYEKKSIMPKYKDIFRVFTLLSYSDLKVVMLGQDPYPQRDKATGVAFGNQEEPLSPSLQILMEACLDLSSPTPPHQFDITLESWVKQGVLLLNSSLTVEENKPGSHAKIWESFIAKLLKNICNFATGIIFVLMGKQAQCFESYINKQFNHIIKTPHPSYYARINQSMPHDAFYEIDKLLIEKYGETIQWYKLI